MSVENHLFALMDIYTFLYWLQHFDALKCVIGGIIVCVGTEGTDAGNGIVHEQHSIGDAIGAVDCESIGIAFFQGVARFQVYVAIIVSVAASTYSKYIAVARESIPAISTAGKLASPPLLVKEFEVNV